MARRDHSRLAGICRVKKEDEVAEFSSAAFSRGNWRRARRDMHGELSTQSSSAVVLLGSGPGVANKFGLLAHKELGII